MSDVWDFYFCQVEDQPASIFVDLGIQKELPIADLNDLAWLRLHLRQPRPDGLSSKEEYDRLCEIEDALPTGLATAEFKILYVGRNTSNCCRDFYFYTENGTQAESCLSMFMVAFREYEFDVGSRPDPGWRTYRDFLYPSPRSIQTIRNHHVLIALKKSGDIHDIDREIRHWIYFQTSEARVRYLAAVAEKGYAFISERETGKEKRPYELIISRSHAVDLNTINNMVLELFDLAGDFGGDYDGWETSVERGNGPKPESRQPIADE